MIQISKSRVSPKKKNSEIENLAKMSSLGTSQLLDPMLTKHIPTASMLSVTPKEVNSTYM